ncbi:Nucleoside diphosphate kinase 7 [Camelus dromedarius]|uniref:Nucleoside diphosphate kinase 7 n=1 Tax=Camelus dromedarius TaxID=9838 RepID=A0A5N4CFZ8_CAMDR|nr:hypothetical protein CB1_000902032 [Camelus ferus]KAB1257836.1 Nucleoside diphosphate kinase 7 [Camelus dromedarius]
MKPYVTGKDLLDLQSLDWRVQLLLEASEPSLEQTAGEMQLTVLILFLVLPEKLPGVLHPGILRAIFGKSETQFAVHCVDLTEGRPLEVQCFFKILDN